MIFKRDTKTALLRKVPLFRDLSTSQLKQIARLADEIEVRAGKRLATAGERGLELFVVIEGHARVALPRRGGAARNLGPGEFFGEMSLLDGEPRSASVEAVTDMQLLVVGRREFWQLLNAAPPLVARIMSTLSRRVRAAEALVAE